MYERWELMQQPAYHEGREACIDHEVRDQPKRHNLYPAQTIEWYAYNVGWNTFSDVEIDHARATLNPNNEEPAE